MRQLKDAIRVAVWDNVVPVFGIDVKDVKKISVIDDDLSFDLHFKLSFKDGNQKTVKLNESIIYESLYNNENIYTVAGQPVCAMLDIALAKGGPEAIAESYYSCMRSQQQDGGQSNETLSVRTKLSWCLPSLENCADIIKNAAELYNEGEKGNKKLKPHRAHTFFSTRTNSYAVSKVVDRLQNDLGRCPFLAPNK